MNAVVEPDDVVFTMDSTIGQAVTDQARAFRQAVPVGSVIITKLDGHAKVKEIVAIASPISSKLCKICKSLQIFRRVSTIFRFDSLLGVGRRSSISSGIDR